MNLVSLVGIAQRAQHDACKGAPLGVGEEPIFIIMETEFLES